MSLILIEKNIVILGAFKPTKFDKLFFIKNNLANGNDFTEKSIFISDFSLVDTNEFTVNITPNSIVINTKNENINNNIQKIASFIILNNDTNITAIGYNLKWSLFLQKDLNEITKELFFANNNNTINKFFSTNNTAYGYYVSRDYEYSRLKLDIKPSLIQKIDTNEKIKVLIFDFNFHIENTFTNEQLNNIVLDYENFINLANTIISEYE
jgi:hypothetical protein